MKLSEARKIVEREILSSQPECAIIESATLEYSSCFVFYYQSKKFIETENFDEMLVGQGPVFVSRDNGEVYETGSAYSTEHYLKAFELCGNPYGQPTNKVKIVGWNEGANKVQATKLIKAVSGLGLSHAKAIVDTVLSNKESLFEVNTTEDVESVVTKLNEYGFISKQLWSNQSQ
ncbi:hypothetical protein AB835_11075 [Candidatus Endobugula sertula]|uniref:Immunity protein 35 domain-containing protein n=1 Tax=Candidatus Endobugula sertula TaxID=62101 RepID=A0A1D2QN89_9GAMM|nr:hypothetical protein AB835_11075 [Candidatus Endobugula sertula]